MKTVYIPILATVTVAISGCGVKNSHNVFAVKRGMTEEQVRATAGAPDRISHRCWLYGVKKTGTSIDGLRVCFTDGRVSLTQVSLHG